MRLLQIPMNSTSVSKNNLLDVSQLSPLDSKKASAFVEISWATTQSSKIRSLHSELQWTFFTIKSDNDIVVPFFWPQPAFLRDHYQPFWFTTFCHIHKSFGASHNTHHAARTLSLPQDTYVRFAFSRKYKRKRTPDRRLARGLLDDDTKGARSAGSIATPGPGWDTRQRWDTRE